MDMPQKVRPFLGHFLWENQNSLSFKKSCVEKIIKEKRYIRSLARELGIEASMIDNWVRFYRHYGESGLMRKTTTVYDKEFKLQVLHYIKKHNFSLREASLKFNISDRSIIRNWQIAYEKSYFRIRK